MNGDFSRLEPLFQAQPPGVRPRILEWYDAGRFGDEPRALAEALTCACFLGTTEVAEYFLNHGVHPSGGNGTGLDVMHWAANRGQLEAVRLLLGRGARLDTRSMYGGGVAGTAVGSAINEPRPEHLQIIEELLAAGAPFPHEEYPTERKQIDDILKRHRP